MLKIGLTGGIGSGKTTVAKVFELLGVPVYFADEASKSLYRSNKELRAALIKKFGEDIYSGNEINRGKLASIVFSDREKLRELNDLVHPLTIRDAREWMAKQNSPYIIKEAALLFESGSAADLDYIIGVSAPLEIRIQRVMQRDGSERSQVLDRISKQMDEETKLKRCDYIIRNDESELVIPQVLDLHRTFVEKTNS